MLNRMLIADADRDFLRAAGDYFEAEGFEVERARDPQEVRALLERQQFSVAILNMQLGGVTVEQGVSGLLIAKTISPSTPFILITSFPSVEAVREGLGACLYGGPAAADFIATTEGFKALLEAVLCVLAVAGENGNEDSYPDTLSA